MSWSSVESFSRMEWGPVKRAMAWMDSTLLFRRFVASSAPTLGVVLPGCGSGRSGESLKAGWLASCGHVSVLSRFNILFIMLSDSVGDRARMYDPTTARRRVSSTSIGRPFDTRGSYPCHRYLDHKWRYFVDLPVGSLVDGSYTLSSHQLLGRTQSCRSLLLMCRQRRRFYLCIGLDL